MIKQIWFGVNTYSGFRWNWTPKFLRSQIVFGRGGKMWLAPHWELSWGLFVFHWTGYNREKEYDGTYREHECPAELMQDRINELENAIRVHRDQVTNANAMYVDSKLWKVLDSVG